MKWAVRFGFVILLAASFAATAAARLPETGNEARRPSEGGRIELLFVDPDGTPWPDVELRLDWEGTGLEDLFAGRDPSMPGPVRAGADGRYLLDLSGGAPGFHSIRITMEDGRSPGPEDGRRLLSGRLYFYDPGGVQSRTVVLRKKEFSLVAWMAEEGGSLAEPGPFLVSPFDPGNPMHLAARASAAGPEAISLRITDPAGKPVRGLSCRVNDQTAVYTTDSDGRCTIPARIGFPQAITLQNGYEGETSGGICRLVTPRGSGGELALVWEGPLPENSYANSPGRIELTVLDHSGERAENVPVALYRPGETGPGRDCLSGVPAAWAYTDSEGRFVWCVATPGDYRIEAGGICRDLRYTGGVQLVAVRRKAPPQKKVDQAFTLEDLNPGFTLTEIGPEQYEDALAESPAALKGPVPVALRVRDRQVQPVDGLCCEFDGEPYDLSPEGECTLWMIPGREYPLSIRRRTGVSPLQSPPERRADYLVTLEKGGPSHLGGSALLILVCTRFTGNRKGEP